MEFHEKLQELRKSKGLTQEELAEILYVSRTAVSKWKSGRGYPNIESLKGIAAYFSVTIDDLLSGEKILSIAEKENKSNLRNMCDWLFAVMDICACMLIILPLYPKTVEGFIYSVNLFAYTEIAPLYSKIYWVGFSSIIIFGIIKIILIRCRIDKYNRIMADLSMGIHVLTVLFLAMTREAYAVTVAFLLFVMKGILFLKGIKAGS